MSYQVFSCRSFKREQIFMHLYQSLPTVIFHRTRERNVRDTRLYVVNCRALRCSRMNLLVYRYFPTWAPMPCSKQLKTNNLKDCSHTCDIHKPGILSLLLHVS